MSKYCAYCGSALMDGDLFCSSCGAKQPAMPVPAISQACEAQGVSADMSAEQLDTQKTTPGSKKKRTRVVILSGIIMVVVAAILFWAISKGLSNKPPFYGIQLGTGAEEVEKKLGKPDDIDDNGMSNFHYYYEEVEFLGMKGYVDYHFERDRLDTMRFISSAGTMNGYNEAVQYYTKKYGEPSTTISNFSDYYAESERAFWELEDGTNLMVEYHSYGRIEPPRLCVEIEK